MTFLSEILKFPAWIEADAAELSWDDAWLI
jgi:hypothetical protein